MTCGSLLLAMCTFIHTYTYIHIHTSVVHTMPRSYLCTYFLWPCVFPPHPAAPSATLSNSFHTHPQPCNHATCLTLPLPCYHTAMTSPSGLGTTLEATCPWRTWLATTPPTHLRTTTLPMSTPRSCLPSSSAGEPHSLTHSLTHSHRRHPPLLSSHHHHAALACPFPPSSIAGADGDSSTTDSEADTATHGAGAGAGTSTHSESALIRDFRALRQRLLKEGK